MRGGKNILNTAGQKFGVNAAGTLGRRTVVCVLAGGALLLGASAAQAAFLVQPADAVATDHFSSDLAVDTVNGNGFDETEKAMVNTGDPVPTTYPSHNTAATDNWLAESNVSPALPAITFTLGSSGESYQLTGLHIWNHNENNNADRSVNQVSISFSDDGVTYGNDQILTFNQAPAAADYTGESYSLLSDVTAGYVRFEVISNYGDPGYVGLSEVRFIAVPEPASAALVGLGGLALLRRARR